jgi:L-lysine 2,3-aminomutase
MKQVWADVPDEQWMDWRWQMSNRLNSPTNWAVSST